MAGINEILVLVLLVTCILILPRLFKGKPVRKTSSFKKVKKFTAKMRFGIILTIMYPLFMALYLKPWDGALIPYISYGIIPVFLGWAVVWILAGRKK